MSHRHYHTSPAAVYCSLDTLQCRDCSQYYAPDSDYYRFDCKDGTQKHVRPMDWYPSLEERIFDQIIILPSYLAENFFANYPSLRPHTTFLTSKDVLSKRLCVTTRENNNNNERKHSIYFRLNYKRHPIHNNVVPSIGTDNDSGDIDSDTNLTRMINEFLYQFIEHSRYDSRYFDSLSDNVKKQITTDTRLRLIETRGLIKDYIAAGSRVIATARPKQVVLEQQDTDLAMHDMIQLRRMSDDPVNQRINKILNLSVPNEFDERYIKATVMRRMGLAPSFYVLNSKLLNN